MEIEFIGENTVPVDDGQTVLEASLQGGIPIFHACGGNAKCSTCRIQVNEGAEFLNPINQKEEKLRRTIALAENVRLACQTTVTQGTVRVRRIVVDQTDTSNPSAYAGSAVEISNARKPLGEESRLVLFFLDIRDFTLYAETHLPYDVIHVLSRLFNIFHDVISRHDGEIIETAGDEIYAVFGLQSSIKKASENAIKAGLIILKELERFNNSQLNVSFSNELKIGIGIHSGTVIVGEFQLGHLKKTSVMGRAVNIASRIQNATKEVNNSMLVTDDVARYYPSSASFEDRSISLKGIRMPYKVHLLGKPYYLRYGLFDVLKGL